MRLLIGLVACSFSASVLIAQNPFTDDARQTYALNKTSLLAAAEKMPAEHYTFRTVPEVRSFAEMIAHTVDGQTLMCAVVKGETAPGARVSPGSATKTKAGLLNWNISHNNEMYGIIAAFLRIKGIVPPSSEGRP
jgi:DinB superfamily